MTAHPARRIPTTIRRGRRPTTRLAALTAVFLLAVAACASDDATAPSTDAPVTDVPVTDDTVPAPDTAPGATTTPASEPTDSTPGADDGADTIAPPTEPAPPTTEPAAAPTATVPGPLPTPDVGLIQVGQFDAPVDVATRFLDPRFFVVQKGGQIVAFDDEASTTVLDLDDVDGVDLSTGNEQGLLGVAFQTDTDLAYVNYTNAAGTTVVAEFAIDPLTAVFDPSSYREVLTIEQPFENHNGGDLAFGPDGYLYIATGDGGSGGDPERNSLDLTNRLGKLLRIDPAPTDDGRPFGVPDDNPFLGADDADPTIWSYGLRNPWKFSFDPLTNDLWIGDVGQNAFEEIDLAPATDGADAGRGLSFGWSAFEGNERFNDDQPADGHVPPVVTYSHADGGCSVSAGAVARDSSYSDLNGWYVYGDFCSGQIWALDTTSVGISDGTVVGAPIVVEIAQVPSLVAVRAGTDGDLYALSIAGEMFRIVEA